MAKTPKYSCLFPFFNKIYIKTKSGCYLHIKGYLTVHIWINKIHFSYGAIGTLEILTVCLTIQKRQWRLHDGLPLALVKYGTLKNCGVLGACLKTDWDFSKTFCPSLLIGDEENPGSVKNPFLSIQRCPTLGISRVSLFCSLCAHQRQNYTIG